MDEKLVELVSMLTGAPETDVSSKLRNWSDAAREYLASAAEAASDEKHRQEARRIFSTLSELRELRHRAIHDAVVVGIFGDAQQGYTASPLRAGYVKSSGKTARRLETMSADGVAELAMRYYDLNGDAQVLLFQMDPQHPLQ